MAGCAVTATTRPLLRGWRWCGNGGGAQLTGTPGSARIDDPPTPIKQACTQHGALLQLLSSQQPPLPSSPLQSPMPRPSSSPAWCWPMLGYWEAAVAKRKDKGLTLQKSFLTPQTKRDIRCLQCGGALCRVAAALLRREPGMAWRQGWGGGDGHRPSDCGCMRAAHQTVPGEAMHARPRVALCRVHRRLAPDGTKQGWHYM